MQEPKVKQEKKYRRHRRVRAKVFGTKSCPRLSVFRSARHIYVQLIDDEKRRTLAASSDLELTHPPIKRKKSSSGQKRSGAQKKKGKVALAHEVGKLIAQKALKKKIKKVVFDRGSYKYHGRVKALAEGAREGGLEF